jgi:MerR family transcriptional regulator, heat shock protein HspR
MSILPKELDNPEAPLFPIGVVAEILHVTDQTLRVYEKSGLIQPGRRKKDRYYSANDVVWLKCLRRFLKKEGINLKGIERLLKVVPCYEISPCEDCNACTAHLKRSITCSESASVFSSKSEGYCLNCNQLMRKE